MKTIDTHGILNIEPLDGSRDWYWATDYTNGDLYEAEELYKTGHSVKQNQLLFVHYPYGKMIQPVIATEGQYLGRPICCNGMINILLADFPAGEIRILQYDRFLKKGGVLTTVPLSAIQDCYNLLLKGSPLLLTRQGNDNSFQILWPEPVSFPIEDTEAFCCRIGDRLYFSAWYEDPEYREETIVRKLDGSIVSRTPGSLMIMPDGQLWQLV